MASLSDVYPYVMPSVQGCPIGMVDTAIRNSLMEFCEKTRIWKYMCPTISLVDQQSLYPITSTDDNSIISMPTYVGVDGFNIAPTNEEDLYALDPLWRKAESRRPIFYYMDYNDNINLIPIPNLDPNIPSVMQVEVSLKPSVTSTTFPDWIFNNWVEVIADGALMRLHTMPGKVWANPQIVSLYRGKYRDGITRAKSRAMKSFARQGKNAQPRRFWE